MAVSDAHVYAVGQITMAHSNLDFTLSLLLLGYLHPDRRVGRLLLANQRYDEKVELLRRLHPLVDKSRRHADALEKLHPRLKEAGRLRNEIVHAAWTTDDPDNVTMHISQTNWQRNLNEASHFVMKNHTPESLMSIAEKINATHETLMQFSIDAGAIPWSDEPPSEED